MALGYASLYANGLNDNSQIRRSADMIYQRGGSYLINLTGTTYISSMELDVDLYGNDTKVGRMSLVPYDISLSGATYWYKFNLRPYTYMSNYVQGEHYQNYWLNDWAATTQLINVENPYPNNIKANYKYGYKYFSGNTIVYEYVGAPTNDLNHFTDIPEMNDDPGFYPSSYQSTGNYFDYVGGSFQPDNSFILPNYDQEVGTTIGSGFTQSSVSVARRLSPMSTYLMDYPTVPEQSETARFLTDAPRIQYIQNDENYVLYYLNGQTGDKMVIEADYAVFEFYNTSNTKIGTYNRQLNMSGTTYASPTGYTDTLKPFALPCGPVDITNLFTGITWSSVAYYRVQLFYSYATQSANRTSVGPVGPVSEAFYFYLYDNCKPESTRVVFLNERGGYDYYTFQSYRQDTKKIKATTYDNRYFSTTLSSPDRNVGRTVKTFDTDINQEIVLESDYLSVGQGNWLEQLFYSPQVYIMKSDFISPIDRSDKVYKYLTPVQIISTDVETITKKHKKLNKYKITLQSSDNFFVNKGF